MSETFEKTVLLRGIASYYQEFMYNICTISQNIAVNFIVLNVIYEAIKE